jgi:hypothetical protein
VRKLPEMCRFAQQRSPMPPLSRANCLLTSLLGKKDKTRVFRQKVHRWPGSWNTACPPGLS